jgi:hypothetical protein
MALNTTEVIFFKVRNEVEPEDPANLQGEALLKLFRATQQQSSHHSSAWGRTVEDPNTLVWVIGALYMIASSLFPTRYFRTRV